MKRLSNVHPGSILKEEFLTPHGITINRLAKALFIPTTCVSQILNCKRPITADTALHLSKYFGNSVKFWLGLQMDFDIEEESRGKNTELNAIKKYSQRAA